MDTLQQYLATVPDEKHREAMESLIEWVANSFPELRLEIKWNQPMMIRNDTFILAFSCGGDYVSIAAWNTVLYKFLYRLKESRYGHHKKEFQIPWDQKSTTICSATLSSAV